MATDLITGLLPILSRSLDPGFNVFDVMHHGDHEKQMSNVFRWLLEPGGSHNFGDAFQRIFIDEINHGLPPGQPLPPGPYSVRQEVNTSGVGDGGDIADLALSSESVRVVVENYFTSDGHGHSYTGYLRHGEQGGRRGVVVLLCRDEDRSLQTNGWENAAVVTYRGLVARLRSTLSEDRRYVRENPDAFAFVDQMYRKFTVGAGRMGDRDVLDFITEMCATGEARRYQHQRVEQAAERFAEDVAQQARERFSESRELLHRIKKGLLNYSDRTLRVQLNETFEADFIARVSARYSGIYQWTVNFHLGSGYSSPEGAEIGEDEIQFKFGPSAWHANNDGVWRRTVDPATADYTRVFLTHRKRLEIRQSAVTLQEVLDGIRPDDRRLHDEIVQLSKRKQSEPPEVGACPDQVNASAKGVRGECQ